ncbi:fibronectin type-III domain-containing protein 3A [Caerostris extrusa]|uniref:Fibronectin type-III domain-containing protein 3A n=1 Tax=Caerostris extrusa TaxID=172846 RepID=A0AAV4PRP3_CAEEX|nr:fibronectin type-III domain-containing protein 3A [Caerostris extrusa]
MRIVQNNSQGPVPVQLQVPSGHLVHQVMDENGTVRHYLFSPPMPMPVGPHYGMNPRRPHPPPSSVVDREKQKRRHLPRAVFTQAFHPLGVFPQPLLPRSSSVDDKSSCREEEG